MKLSIDLSHSKYDIVIERGLLSRIGNEVKEVLCTGNKIFVLTDENVDKYYGDKVVMALE